MNELNQWLSAIRKVSIYNERMLPSFHPGAHRSGKWTCCLHTDRVGKHALITSDLHQMITTLKNIAKNVPTSSRLVKPHLHLKDGFVSVAHHGSIKGWFSVTGCSRTHSAVTLGDWSDPLDPDVETQTIYKQLLQGRDKLRSGWTVAYALLLLDTRGLCCSMGVLCCCQPLLASQSYILLKRQVELRGK